MTEHQILVAQALERCTMLPGSVDKKFARHFASRSRSAGELARELSAPQAWKLEQLAWRYRRQMPPALVPSKEPERSA